jgi:hypothetical protein|tara:strand:- start:2318 stop:2428 length:111 start_codon:yes stop_codon:yes gene_type:complete
MTDQIFIALNNGGHQWRKMGESNSANGIIIAGILAF